MQLLPLTGVVLAGGKSSRMGRDKALLKWGAGTLVENIVSLLCRTFAQTLVIVDRRAKLEGLDLKSAAVYEDVLKDRGPLGGIYTALLYSDHAACCVLTCDMPHVGENLLAELCAETADGALCFEGPEGRCHPFPGIYHARNRGLMRRFIERGELSMKRFLEAARAASIPMPREQGAALANMNTREDYVSQKLGARP